MRSIRVVIVDEQELFRAGIRRLLESAPRIQVVGEAGEAEEVLAMLETTACQVVVLDQALPGRDGLWLLHQLKTRFSALRSLMLVGQHQEQLAVEALTAGANGYMVKSASLVELISAITQVHDNGFYLNPRWSHLILGQFQGARHAAPATSSSSHVLTERERVILQKAANGFNNREIASQVALSESTVKAQLRGVFRKLEVNDRVQAIVRALDAGLIQATDASDLPSAMVRSSRGSCHR